MLFGQQGKEYLDVHEWTISGKTPKHREKAANHTPVPKLLTTAKFRIHLKIIKIRMITYTQLSFYFEASQNGVHKTQVAIWKCF